MRQPFSSSGGCWVSRPVLGSLASVQKAEHAATFQDEEYPNRLKYLGASQDIQ